MKARTATIEEYTSHNTTQLDIEGAKEKVLTVDYVKQELAGKAGTQL